MSNVIALYGKMLAFSRMKVFQANLDAIFSAVADLDNSKKVPVLIESDEMLDLQALIDGLWAYQIAVIGVVDGVLNEQAEQLKMAIFPADGKRIARLDDKKAGKSSDNFDNKPTPSDTLLDKTQDDTGTVVAVQGTNMLDEQNKSIALDNLVHKQMIRSGQSVHHMGGDLIITASVNQGAEVATDYNLHIYGKGQGRLVAGATGDEKARIFCQKFDPSLVSVAGTYCLKDDIPSEMINQAVEVSFSSEKGLVFTLMSQ